MDKEKLILVGGGGHCKSCIDVIELEGRFAIAGIVDVPEKIGKKVLGYEIVASDEMLTELVIDYKYFLITAGHIQSPQIRIKLYNKIIKLGVNLPIVISPLAYVSPHSNIGNGTIIMHHSLVNAEAIIGSNCIINSKALVEHDAQVGDHCHISTSSIVNGGVIVGSGTFYGSGAVSNQYTTIKEGSFIKANSIVK